MIYNLIVTKEGVLKLQVNENWLVPLTYLQKENQLNDFDFLSEFFSNDIYFEEGLTFGKFMQSIEPWGNFLSKYLKKDIVAFIKESKKLHLVKENEFSLDYISLFSKTTISPCVSYEKRKEKESLKDLLQKEGKLNGLWKIEEGYKLTGFKYNEEEHYSVSHNSLDELSNIPFYLNDIHCVLFEEHSYKKILGKERSILNKENINTIQLNDHYSIDYMKTEKIHTFEDVLKGVFEEFEYSPERRNDMTEFFKNALNEVLDKKESLIENKDIDIELEVMKEKDDMYENHQRELAFWERLVKKYELEKNNDIIIGKIKENRIFNKKVID